MQTHLPLLMHKIMVNEVKSMSNVQTIVKNNSRIFIKKYFLRNDSILLLYQHNEKNSSRS